MRDPEEQRRILARHSNKRPIPPRVLLLAVSAVAVLAVLLVEFVLAASGG